MNPEGRPLLIRSDPVFVHPAQDAEALRNACPQAFSSQPLRFFACAIDGNGVFSYGKTPDMPDDPRPEPVAMTDDEIAKLAPLKGEESFSVRFAVNVDLEPNCKGPVPFLGPHFCELTRKQF